MYNTGWQTLGTYNSSLQTLGSVVGLLAFYWAVQHLLLWAA